MSDRIDYFVTVTSVLLPLVLTQMRVMICIQPAV